MNCGGGFIALQDFKLFAWPTKNAGPAERAVTLFTRRAN